MHFKTFSFILLITFFVTNFANRRGPKNPKDVRPPGIAFSIIRPNQLSRFQSDNTGAKSFIDCYYDAILYENGGRDLLREFSHPWFDVQQFDTKDLQQFCGNIAVLQECLKECPDSEYKAAMMKTFTPFDFVCNQSDYIQKAPCYKNVVQESNELCHGADKCESQLKTLKDNYDDVYEEDNDNTTSYIASQCDYYLCYLPCIKQSTINQCTEDGFHTLKQNVQMKINAVKGMFASLDAEYVEPEQCKRFRSEDD